MLGLLVVGAGCMSLFFLRGRKVAIDSRVCFERIDSAGFTRYSTHCTLRFVLCVSISCHAPSGRLVLCSGGLGLYISEAREF